MEPPPKKAPRRKDDRIILQFDYDCFYAQVCEHRNPALRSKPLGIKQKNIIATCNYNARAKGARKLMLVTEAKKVCPDLVLVDGEDLTPFRDASKTLYGYLKSHSWNGKVERLGFDEVFMGCIEGVKSGFNMENPLFVQLLLASHLALYLRTKLEEDFGYTSTCGVSTNKVLSKLVGSRNKPRNQTTLVALSDNDVTAFMDDHVVRKVPGIGSKMASLLEAHLTGSEIETNSHAVKSTLTVGDVRCSDLVSPAQLENLLGGPGAEKGIGARIWALLHGADATEVKEAGDIPTQLSIEDTYGGLVSIPQITEELHKLSCSLIRRMRIDLLSTEVSTKAVSDARWLARPKTLRLSIRSWNQMHEQNYNRSSRSGPLPNFIFDLKADIEHIAERLVAETLIPLLRRLQTERGSKWNLQLINICVANMAVGAAEDKSAAGRDIANMFKTQDEVLKHWKVASSQGEIELKDRNVGKNEEPSRTMMFDNDKDDDDEVVEWETGQGVCPDCGYHIPSFALAAHTRYHNSTE